MAINPLTPAITQGNLTTAYQVVYTVPTGVDRAGIDAVVFNNYSVNTATFSVRIIQSGAGTVLNEVITNKAIRAGFNDLAPAMIGQALNPGAKVQVKADQNDAISMTMTVTTITS